MRPKGRMWLVVAILGTAAIGVMSVVVWNGAFRGSGLRLHHMKGITPGMTRGEVEGLLGGPPGDYRSDPERFGISHHSIFALGFEEWIADEAKIEVWFDTDGRVTQTLIRPTIDKRLFPFRVAVERFLNRISQLVI